MDQNDRATEYLRTKVLTASPEELHLILYDGAIKFADQARRATEEKRFEDSHNALIRAQNIILEMSSTLDHGVAPELCGKLSSLYHFVYRRLVEANLHRHVTAIDDALMILRYQRETWVLLMEKLLTETKAASADEKAQEEQDQQPSVLSVEA